MFNRTEIMMKAWADYRRDDRMGLIGRRGDAFNRKHFAYCLRMVWAVAKETAACVTQVAAPKPAVKLLSIEALERANAIKSELEWMQYGDFTNWARHTSLNAELVGLTA